MPALSAGGFCTGGVLLTCWDSLAAAAASPVSMEATLVPSRTGLSCLGTEGPTLALGKKGSVPQWAARTAGTPGPTQPSLLLSPGTPHKLGRVSERPNRVGDPICKVDSPPPTASPVAAIWGPEAKAALPGPLTEKKPGRGWPTRGTTQPTQEHLAPGPGEQQAGTPLSPAQSPVPVAVLQVDGALPPGTTCWAVGSVV